MRNRTRGNRRAQHGVPSLESTVLSLGAAIHFDVDTGTFDDGIAPTWTDRIAGIVWGTPSPANRPILAASSGRLNSRPAWTTTSTAAHFASYAAGFASLFGAPFTMFFTVAPDDPLLGSVLTFDGYVDGIAQGWPVTTANAYAYKDATYFGLSLPLTTAVNVVTLTWTGAVYSARLNGVATDSGAWTQAMSIVQLALPNAYGGAMLAHYGDLIVFGRALTAETARRVELSMMRKFGIT